MRGIKPKFMVTLLCDMFFSAQGNFRTGWEFNNCQSHW